LDRSNTEREVSKRNSNLDSSKSLVDALEVYFKYYELIQDNIFLNSAQKERVIQNFNVLKKKLMDYMNESERNMSKMYLVINQLAKKKNASKSKSSN